jgi:hypothetical protein
MLCQACPAFKAKYEQLKAKGEQQRKAGTPLATRGQRVDVVKAKAEAAGVRKATAKKVEKVKKGDPGAVAEIAAGRTTANKELKKLAGKGRKGGAKEKRKQTTPDEGASTKKSPALTCMVQLELQPREGMSLEEVANQLRIGKAEIRGLYVWFCHANTVVLEPGAPLPKKCLATVTAIRAAKGFKLEEEA